MQRFMLAPNGPALRHHIRYKNSLPPSPRNHFSVPPNSRCDGKSAFHPNPDDRLDYGLDIIARHTLATSVYRSSAKVSKRRRRKPKSDGREVEPGSIINSIDHNQNNRYRRRKKIAKEPSSKIPFPPVIKTKKPKKSWTRDVLPETPSICSHFNRNSLERQEMNIITLPKIPDANLYQYFSRNDALVSFELQNFSSPREIKRKSSRKNKTAKDSNSSSKSSKRKKNKNSRSSSSRDTKCQKNKKIRSNSSSRNTKRQNDKKCRSNSSSKNTKHRKNKKSRSNSASGCNQLQKGKKCRSNSNSNKCRSNSTSNKCRSNSTSRCSKLQKDKKCRSNSSSGNSKHQENKRCKSNSSSSSKRQKDKKSKSNFSRNEKYQKDKRSKSKSCGKRKFKTDKRNSAKNLTNTFLHYDTDSMSFPYGIYSYIDLNRMKRQKCEESQRRLVLITPPHLKCRNPLAFHLNRYSSSFWRNSLEFQSNSSLSKYRSRVIRSSPKSFLKGLNSARGTTAVPRSSPKSFSKKLNCARDTTTAAPRSSSKSSSKRLNCARGTTEPKSNSKCLKNKDVADDIALLTLKYEALKAAKRFQMQTKDFGFILKAQSLLGDRLNDNRDVFADELCSKMRAIKYSPTKTKFNPNLVPSGAKGRFLKDTVAILTIAQEKRDKYYDPKWTLDFIK